MKRTTLFTMALILAMAATAQAAVPQLINYQGYLKESGVAVNGTKSVTFTLYDASSGGSQLCTSGAQSVTVTNGLFSYKIGSGGCNLSSIDWDASAVYLELTVEGTTLTPREQITGSAYSVETQAVNVEFAPAGDIAATDVQAAIEELDAEKLSLTGGTVTGTINATAFTGDGSGLTGVVASGSVAKTGDTMSGSLVMNADSSTATLEVNNMSGTGVTAHFTNASATATLYTENTNAGNGYGIYANQTGSGYAILGAAGLGGTGVRGDTAGTAGYGIYGIADGTSSTVLGGNHIGTTGNLIQLRSAGSDMLVVDKTGNVFASGTVTATSFTGDGSGLSGVVASGGVAKTGDTMSGALGIAQGAATASLYVYQTGTTDEAGYFEIANASNNRPSVSSANNGSGAAYYGLNTGTGRSGNFEISNVSNPSDALNAGTDGAGNAIYAISSGSGSLYSGNHSGASGSLLKLQSSGSDMFVVDKSGNVFASGTFTGDGSGLTGVVASGAVAKTGDTMSGSLVMNADSSTATLEVNNPVGIGVTAHFTNTAATATIFVENSNASGYSVYGSNANGIGVYGYSSGGHAIKGQSVNNAGVRGDSNNLIGVWGTSSGSDGIGVQGNTVSNGIGVAALNTGWGKAFKGINSGTGNAGYFETTNTANATDTVYITTNSTTAGGNGLFSEHTGTGGVAGVFRITNASNANYALGASTTGAGNAVSGHNYGTTGRGGGFQISNVASTGDAVGAVTNGTGNLYWGNHTGASGNLIQLQSGGSDMLVVDKTGSIFASGTVTATTFSGDGSGITGLTADGGVPIGTVVAWLKTFTGTPAIPTGWVECNGQVLSDATSPYNGQTIPDLNGGNRFLRGATSSGGTGGSLGKTTAANSGTICANTGCVANMPSEGHTHSISDIQPPYYDVVWIIRVK